MSHPATALQIGLIAHLKADGELIALLGAAAIHEVASPRAALPHVVVAPGQTRDRSGVGAGLIEHRVELVVRTAEAGYARLGAIADRITRTLDDASPALDGHRVVGLSVAGCLMRRDPDTRSTRATITLFVLTEAL